MSAATHVVSRAAVSGKQMGWLGIGLGALAWFIALPPLLVRTPVPSLLLGAMAVRTDFYRGAMDVLALCRAAGN